MPYGVFSQKAPFRGCLDENQTSGRNDEVQVGEMATSVAVSTMTAVPMADSMSVLRINWALSREGLVCEVRVFLIKRLLFFAARRSIRTTIATFAKRSKPCEEVKMVVMPEWSRSI